MPVRQYLQESFPFRLPHFAGAILVVDVTCDLAMPKPDLLVTCNLALPKPERNFSYNCTSLPSSASLSFAAMKFGDQKNGNLQERDLPM